MGKGRGTLSFNLIKKSNLRLARGKQNLKATCTCLKGKLEFVFFLQPYDIDSYELDIQMNISYFTIAKLYEIK